MIRRLAVLALVIGGALLLEPLRVPTEGVIAPRSLFLLGVLLLAADTFGALAHEFGLPRIVGYLLVGLVLGPSVSNIVPARALVDMDLTKRLAVGLIGLLAGTEFKLSDLRQRWRSILGIVGLQLLFVVPLLMLFVVAGRQWMPFAAGLPLPVLLALGFTLAALLSVNSPMVTLALLSETKASGPVAKTVLGVVLVADVAVIFLFTLALGIAEAVVTPGGESVAGAILRLVSGVLSAMFAGVVLGTILTLYLQYVKRELVLFAVVVVFATAAAAEALHFEMLLALLVAGFLVENVAPVRAEPLVRALRQTALPVFVVFFALAGAEVDLRGVLAIWPVALGIALVRAVGVFWAARLGALRGGAEPVVVRRAWMGLISQAGVALGLATLAAERLPVVGPALYSVALGVIALNEAAGPILFRRALLQAGEVAESER